MSLSGIKRVFLIFCVLCLTLTCSGCKDKKEPGILFNSEPITKDNLFHASRDFEAGKRIYYLFYSPKKIEAEFIRVQLVKTGDKIAKGGYKIIWSNDYRIMKQNVYYYYNNFTLYESGRYVMQIFDVNNLSIPLTWNYFFVHD